jgi:hypothetical protein
MPGFISKVFAATPARKSWLSIIACCVFNSTAGIESSLFNKPPSPGADVNFILHEERYMGGMARHAVKIRLKSSATAIAEIIIPFLFFATFRYPGRLKQLQLN